MRRPDGAVVRGWFDGVLDHLDVSAGLEALVALLKELIPVRDAAEHLPDMYEVKVVLGVCPGAEGDIIYFKGAVGRQKAGLDGRQVDAGDLYTGILVGYISAGCQYTPLAGNIHLSVEVDDEMWIDDIHGPYSGASANV